MGIAGGCWPSGFRKRQDVDCGVYGRGWGRDGGSQGWRDGRDQVYVGGGDAWGCFGRCRLHCGKCYRRLRGRSSIGVLYALHLRGVPLFLAQVLIDHDAPEADDQGPDQDTEFKEDVHGFRSGEIVVAHAQGGLRQAVHEQ